MKSPNLTTVRLAIAFAALTGTSLAPASLQTRSSSEQDLFDSFAIHLEAFGHAKSPSGASFRTEVDHINHDGIVFTIASQPAGGVWSMVRAHFQWINVISLAVATAPDSSNLQVRLAKGVSKEIKDIRNAKWSALAPPTKLVEIKFAAPDQAAKAKSMLATLLLKLGHKLPVK